MKERRMAPLPTIVTDLDGTLVNVMDEVIAGIWRDFGVALQPEECVQYSVHESFWQFLQHTFSSVQALNEYLVRNYWTNAAVYARCKPYWDLWRALLEFKRAGGRIVALTGRVHTLAVKAATRTWLDTWGLTGVEVMFTKEADENKGLSEPEAKLHDCEIILETFDDGPVWFVDDQPATCEKVAAAGLEGLVVYMVERPWTFHSFGVRGVKKRYIIQDIEEALKED